LPNVWWIRVIGLAIAINDIVARAYELGIKKPIGLANRL
jgi:hypothetical protein